MFTAESLTDGQLSRLHEGDENRRVRTLAKLALVAPPYFGGRAKEELAKILNARPEPCAAVSNGMSHCRDREAGIAACGICKGRGL